MSLPGKASAGMDCSTACPRLSLLESFQCAAIREDLPAIAEIGLALLEQQSSPADVPGTVALALVGLGRLQEARSVCEQAMERGNDDPELSRISTVVCFHLSDIPATLWHGKRFLAAAGAATVSAREAAEVTNILGLGLLYLKREPEASEAFARAIALDPAFPDAAHNLAAIHIRQGRGPEAIRAVRPALEAQPQDTEALCLFLRGCELCGRYREALEVCERYLEATRGNEGGADRTWVRSRVAEYRQRLAPSNHRPTSLRIFYAATREPDIGYDSSHRYFIEPFRALGHDVVTFDCGRSIAPDADAVRRMNASLYESVLREYRAGGIDLFFSYINDYLIDPDIVRAIGSLGIPTINFTWDDVFSDRPVQLRGKRYLDEPIVNDVSGIAGAYDFFWTNCREAIPVYRQLGTKPICLPGGGNPRLFYPQRLPYCHDVSFVGLNYSYRGQVVEFLRGVGVDIFASGRGFGNGIAPFDEMVRIYSKSKINLGFTGWGSGALGRTPKVVKGRDFEIPMSGGFYLVEYFKELEELYEVGSEVVCYETIGELVEKIAYYLSRDDERERIRERGYMRARTEHTIDQRLERLLKEIGF